MCENLVAALTCPEFRLDELDQGVARTVLAAAVGMDNPCSAIQNATGIQGDGYDWEVSSGAQPTYIAKKGDKEAFRIIFPVDNGGKAEEIQGNCKDAPR